MHLPSLYHGYQRTPLLWKGELFGLQQAELDYDVSSFPVTEFGRLRLGMLVEQFTFHALAQQSNTHVLAQNIQINDAERTIGELDCIYEQDSACVHLEIVYKFYLYDPSVGSNSHDHWIGPNRKDSLVEKVRKLHDQQLPLLHHPKTAQALAILGILPAKLQQHVHFKAQLYLPHNTPQPDLEGLNPECIVGTYLRIEDLKNFTSAKFYLPSKWEWIATPHTQVDWRTIDKILIEIEALLEQQRAPMCWIKEKNGQMSAVFVVWWP